MTTENTNLEEDGGWTLPAHKFFSSHSSEHRHEMAKHVPEGHAVSYGNLDHHLKHDEVVRHAARKAGFTHAVITHGNGSSETVHLGTDKKPEPEKKSLFRRMIEG